jgi:GNAT superfamily N-acetyltransferase
MATASSARGKEAAPPPRVTSAECEAEPSSRLADGARRSTLANTAAARRRRRAHRGPRGAVDRLRRRRCLGELPAHAFARACRRVLVRRRGRCEARRASALVAEDSVGICGTVQWILEQPENQPHRADVARTLVHRRVRRRGLGAALMRAVESTARDCRKSLLVLDAASDGDAARLYERLGWQPVGSVPDYALFPPGDSAARLSSTEKSPRSTRAEGRRSVRMLRRSRLSRYAGNGEWMRSNPRRMAARARGAEAALTQRKERTR